MRWMPWRAISARPYLRVAHRGAAVQQVLLEHPLQRVEGGAAAHRHLVALHEVARHQAGGSLRTSNRPEIGRACTYYVQGDCSYIRTE